MVSAASRTITMGPFAVFDAQASTDRVYEEYGNELDQESNENQASPDTLDSDSSLWSANTSGSLLEQESHCESDFTAENGSSAGPRQNFPKDAFEDVLPKQSDARFSYPPSPHLEISTPLFQDPQTGLLMHHYVNHVADLLQPVLHPGNPWRTTYIPFALNGCSHLSLCQVSAIPDASLALFHSLLSSAAFHLRNLSGGSKKLQKLGLQHRARSLRALNAALLHPDDPEQHTVYLTAMLSLVTIDVSILCPFERSISNGRHLDYHRRRHGLSHSLGRLPSASAIPVLCRRSP